MRALDAFKNRAQLEKLVSSDTKKAASATLEQLLQARRDIASSEEAKAWLTCLSAGDTSDLSESLTRAAFGQVAVEAISTHYEIDHNNIPDKVTSELKCGNLNGALSAIQEAICTIETPRHDLARLYIELLFLKESITPPSK